MSLNNRLLERKYLSLKSETCSSKIRNLPEMDNHVSSIDLALEVPLGCLALHSVLILCYFKPQLLYYKNILLTCYSANWNWKIDFNR